MAIDVDEPPPSPVAVDAEAGLGDAARRVPDASDAARPAVDRQ